MRVHPTTQQVAAAFRTVERSPVFAESAALVARGGRPVEMLQAMSLRPELLGGFAAMSEAIYPGGIVEREVKELIILEASRRNRCQFCADSHVSIARSLGLAEEPMGLLDDLARLPARQRLAVEYTRAAQANANGIPDQFFDALRAEYSEPEIVELTAMIGLISMLNMFNNCLEVRYAGEYERAPA